MTINGHIYAVKRNGQISALKGKRAPFFFYHHITLCSLYLFMFICLCLLEIGSVDSTMNNNTVTSAPVTNGEQQSAGTSPKPLDPASLTPSAPPFLDDRDNDDVDSGECVEAAEDSSNGVPVESQRLLAPETIVNKKGTKRGRKKHGEEDIAPRKYNRREKREIENMTPLIVNAQLLLSPCDTERIKLFTL